MNTTPMTKTDLLSAAEDHYKALRAALPSFLAGVGLVPDPLPRARCGQGRGFRGSARSAPALRRSGPPGHSSWFVREPLSERSRALCRLLATPGSASGPAVLSLAQGLLVVFDGPAAPILSARR